MSKNRKWKATRDLEMAQFKDMPPENVLNTERCTKEIIKTLKIHSYQDWAITKQRLKKINEIVKKHNANEKFIHKILEIDYKMKFSWEKDF